MDAGLSQGPANASIAKQHFLAALALQPKLYPALQSIALLETELGNVRTTRI